MKRRLTALLLTALTLVTGCGGGSKMAEAGAVVVVLVDLTNSAAADANTHMEDVTTVLNAVQSGDKVFVVPITGSFVPEIAASAIMPAPSFNPVSTAKALKAARLKLQTNVAKLLGAMRNGEPGTAILSGIAKAATIFAAEGKDAPHTLVILSDMIEQGRLDFTTVSLTPPDLVIQALGTEGLAPALDADVYVAGITAGQSQTYAIAQERFNAITQFWAAYFGRAGARLRSYDRDLLNFQVKRTG